MSTLHDWLAIPYRAHGRDAAGVDCWGMVRMVRAELRGDLLPAYADIPPDDKYGMTGAAHATLGAMHRCQPRAGAIATAWRGHLCLHVGIVIEADGRLAVLDTTSRTGARWQRLVDFARPYHAVTYHDD